MFKPGDLICSKKKFPRLGKQPTTGNKIRYIVINTVSLDKEYNYRVWSFTNKAILTISGKHINTRYKKIGERSIEMYKTLYEGDQTRQLSTLRGTISGRFAVNAAHYMQHDVDMMIDVYRSWLKCNKATNIFKTVTIDSLSQKVKVKK